MDLEVAKIFTKCFGSVFSRVANLEQNLRLQTLELSSNSSCSRCRNATLSHLSIHNKSYDLSTSVYKLNENSDSDHKESEEQAS